MEINLKQQLEALQTDRFTVGPIKSKCPPIVIQYIENFRVKTSNSQSREIPSTTGKIKFIQLNTLSTMRGIC